MKLTEKKLKNYIKTKEQMEDLIYERITEIIKNLIEYGRYNFMKNWNVDNIEYDGDDVLVTIYETWAYGGYDYSNITFPQSYLYDNYEEKIKLDCEKIKKEKEENDKIAEQKKKEEKEEKEKSDFIRLNQKYGKK